LVSIRLCQSYIIKISTLKLSISAALSIKTTTPQKGNLAQNSQTY
jgi:hypothetical protein